MFAAATGLLALHALRQFDKETRGTFGRRYGNVLDEMMQETARRSRLLAELAAKREGRLARLERRGESSR
jgi:hypothetical protein